MGPPSTPERTVQHKEADTVKKTRFFKAYDLQTRSIKSLTTKHDITKQIAYN
jgi:hypothetical protein